MALRILLVDDNEEVRRGIRSLLAKSPALSVCGEAADGVEAVEMAKDLRPEAILMDIHMPRMDGLQATRIIRRELPDAKVIIVTQNEPAIAERQASEVAAHGFVGKTDLSRELIPVMERVLSGNSATSAADQSPPWLAGGGEIGAAMRAMDWSQTALGSPETWSPALRMMAKFLLANRFPQLLWWGPQFCSLYNEAYAPILGAKHPWAIGRPVSEVWREIWDVLQPLIETPFRGGPATWMEDIQLEIKRRGFVEETHFTVAYSPVPDETVPSGIGGVLATVHEITEKVVGERRVGLLRDLGARSIAPKSVQDACMIAAETLTRHPKDVPFVLFYLLDENRRAAHLACCACLDCNDRGCPRVVELSESAADEVWPLWQALASEEIQIVTDIAAKFERVPSGPWSDPPTAAAVVPIRSNISHQLAGFMIVGISSRLAYDDKYRNFLELMSTQIASMLANARAYEEERKRAEALAEIDRAKTVFFSNVSHEFRTPLTLMLGPLQDLLSRSQTHLSPTAKELLDVVNRNGFRLLRLVNTLLDFSRIEAGRVQAVYEATDLAAFTCELASVFRSATERAGLRLLVDCPPLAEPVYVDRDMWEKIVLNLVSNAFKFTFEGEIAVTLRATPDGAELRVRDTGVGIPSEALPKLFQRFERIPNTRSRTLEGSGIGLALVHELVKLHGGSLRVESVVEKGSTFILTLPFGKEHLPAAQLGSSRGLSSTATGAAPYLDEALLWLPDDTSAATEEMAPPDSLPVPCPPVPRAETRARPRVLIADDNADMRGYLTRLLSERYQVQAVSDGEAVLAAARENPPDLILSDVMMPKLDGLALVRAVREAPDLNDTPVVLLSARAGEESRLEGMQGGADDYLVKPFSARELLARVEGHVKMHRMRRDARIEHERLAKEYETLLNQAPLGVYVVDPELRIRHVNPVALPVFGDISVVGRDLSEVLHILWSPEFAEEILRNFRHTLETGEPFESLEETRQRADRKVIEHYEWRIDRIVLPEGGYGVVCYFRDISAQVTARNALADSEQRFRKLAQTLEEQVRARTSELEQRTTDLLRQSEQLRELSARLLQTQDDERRRIARELHDSAGQTLAVLQISLSQFARNALQQQPDLRPDAEMIVQTLRNLHQEIRTASYLLHPPLLDETGLSSALHWYSQGLTERSGMEIRLEIPENLGRLPKDVELIVFRVVQECLTNIHRHAGSKTAVIRVASNPEGISVLVEDQGKGISPEKLAAIQSGGSGVGIRGMCERLRQFGGELQLESGPSGTRVRVHLPVAPSGSEREFSQLHNSVRG